MDQQKHNSSHAEIVRRLSSTSALSAGGSGFLWPQGLASLTFDKNFFLRPDFSVELFLSTHTINAGKNVSLETLRDDLAVHDKVLASTLIQLVDRDYSDFLNVSANLHGLDEHVGRVTETIASFAATVETCETHFSSQIDRVRLLQARLRELQTTKQHAQNTKRCLKLAQLIVASSSSVTNNDGCRFLQARFVSRFKILSRGLPAFALLEQAQQQVQRCENRLVEHYRMQLMQSLRSSAPVEFDEALEVLETMGRVGELTDLLKADYLLPLFEKPFAESTKLSSADTFAALLHALESGVLINNCFSSVLVVTTPVCSGNKVHTDFYSDPSLHAKFTILFTIILPAALALITTQCQLLFKVTTSSEQFLASYVEGQKFLTAIESYMPSDDMRRIFRQHQCYRHFMQSWNLPVFFQLFMQKMVAQLEVVLRMPLRMLSSDHTLQNGMPQLNHADIEFNTLQVKQFYTLICQCWSKTAATNIIPQLIPRFWRLTLQLLSRLNVWLDTVDTAGGADSSQSSDNNFIDFKINPSVALICDISEFQIFLSDSSSEKESEKYRFNLPALLQTVLSRSKDTRKESSDNKSADLNRTSEFAESLAVARADLASTLQRRVADLSTKLSAVLCAAVGGVHETPRLYRKTNRDLNWKPSAYVERITQTLMICKPIVTKYPDVAHSVLAAILPPVFAEYARQIHVTLDSVRKTEESLRRLRMIRTAQMVNNVVVVENGTNNNSMDGAAGDNRSESPLSSVADGKGENFRHAVSNNMSDDDKIRMKIYIDVKALRDFVSRELLVQPGHVDGSANGTAVFVDREFDEVERNLRRQVQPFIS